MMTPAQSIFVELEKQRKETRDEYEAALEALFTEMGEGAYFQDDEGTVYKLVRPTGTWIKFERCGYLRTKREGEVKGSLSAKEAKDAGF